MKTIASIFLVWSWFCNHILSWFGGGEGGNTSFVWLINHGKSWFENILIKSWIIEFQFFHGIEAMKNW
jgi:hypothetical protein